MKLSYIKDLNTVNKKNVITIYYLDYNRHGSKQTIGMYLFRETYELMSIIGKNVIIYSNRIIVQLIRIVQMKFSNEYYKIIYNLLHIFTVLLKTY